MLKNYLLATLRNIKNQKGHSLINILSLSLGMAAFILIFLFVQYEFSYDTFNKHYDDIYRVAIRLLTHSHSGVKEIALTRGPVGPLMKAEIPEMINYTRISTMENVKLFFKDRSFDEEKIYFVEPSYFEIFSFNIIAGDLGAFKADPFSIIITKKIAQKYFGNSSPLGKVINIGNEQDFTVVGVLENTPPNSHFTMDIISNFEAYIKITNTDFTSWRSNSCYTYVLFSKGINYKDINDKLKALTENYFPKSHGHATAELFIQPMKDIHLNSKMTGELSNNGDIETVYIFSSIAILILLIACINYMNLSTARGARRNKEVGIRKAIGAKRTQLIKQFYTESVIFALLALGIAFIIVLLVLPYFNNYVDRQISVSISNNLLLLLGLIGLILFVGMFSGSYPALYLSSFTPARVLHNELETKRRKPLLRNILVIIQFSISIILIISTVVIKGQLNFILSSDVGYNKNQILTIDLFDADEPQDLNALKNELLNNPSIINVASSTYNPYSIRDRTSFNWEGKSPDLELLTYCGSVDYNFADLYGLKIIEGRNFSEKYPSDAKGAFLINETAAKLLGWENPLGQELIHWSGESGKIVGILKDFNFSSLHVKIEPLYLFLDPNYRNYQLSVKISGLDIPETIKFIEKKYAHFYPRYPFKYEFVDEAFAQAYKNEHDMGNSFSIFSFIAIIISCLGLLGLVSYTVESKTKEVGIRKIMGASISEISFKLIKEFLKLVLLANIIAWPIAYFIINGWLQDFAYRINITMWPFLLSGLIALLIAVATVSYQSIKAALANPVESLKYE